MIQKPLHFAVLAFCWISASSVFDPHRLDSDDTEARLQQLENNLAILQSQTRSKDQKYAAIISSVLSDLTRVNKELSASKQEMSSLKTKIVYLQSANNVTSRSLKIALTDMTTSSELSQLKSQIDNNTVANREALGHVDTVLNKLKTSLNHLPIMQEDLQDLKNETKLIQQNVNIHKHDVKVLYQSVNIITHLVANLTSSEKSKLKGNMSYLMDQVVAVEKTQQFLSVNCSLMHRLITVNKGAISDIQRGVTLLTNESTTNNQMIKALQKDVISLRKNTPSKSVLNQLSSSVYHNTEELGTLRKDANSLRHDVTALQTTRATKTQLTQLSSSVTNNTLNLGHLTSSATGLRRDLTVLQTTGATKTQLTQLSSSVTNNTLNLRHLMSSATVLRHDVTVLQTTGATKTQFTQLSSSVTNNTLTLGHLTSSATGLRHDVTLLQTTGTTQTQFTRLSSSVTNNTLNLGHLTSSATVLRHDVTVLQTTGATKTQLTHLSSSVAKNFNHLTSSATALRHDVTLLQTTGATKAELTQVSSLITKNTLNLGHLTSSVTGPYPLFKANSVGNDGYRIIFGEMVFQTGSGYNPKTGFFTAPSNGTYTFTGILTGKHDAKFHNTKVFIYIGKTSAVEGTVERASTVTITTFVHLLAGMQVSVGCRTCANVQSGSFYGYRVQ